MFSSAGSYPHASVIMKTDGTCFFLEEYAGMSIFCWNVDFCENHAESEEERSSDGKFQHHSAFPSFPSTRKKKKNPTENMQHIPRELLFCFSNLWTLQTNIQINLAEPVVLHHSTFHLLPLLLWPLPLCLMQASHCVFKQKAGYPF